MTRRAVSRCVAVCVLCVGSLFAFADEAGGGKGERGSFTLTFSNRAEQSTNQYIAQRMGWPLLAEESAKVDYNLPDESFEVHALRIAHAKGPEGSLARTVKIADLDDHLAHDGLRMPQRPYGWARRHVAACHDRLDEPLFQAA